MSSRSEHEPLLDSQAALRLVDAALGDELRGLESPARDETAMSHPTAALYSVPNVLLQAYQEINAVVERLREGRGMLQQHAVERLHHTNAKLLEVTSATEVAATDIMDSVDRALSIVDRLESKEAADTSEEAVELRQTLRDELFGVMGHLQFQDITTQQISYASSILGEMEQRLHQLSALFDPSALGIHGPEDQAAEDAPRTFDPRATTQDAEGRQALADQLFGAA
jgi:chemotaxis regulatin CheY-phosphate phosphatase CheZ